MPLLGPTILDLQSIQQVQRQRVMDQMAQQRSQQTQDQAAIGGIIKYFQDEKAKSDAENAKLAQTYGMAAGFGADRPEMATPQLEEQASATEMLTRAKSGSELDKIKLQHLNQDTPEQRMLRTILGLKSREDIAGNRLDFDKDKWAGQDENADLDRESRERIAQWRNAALERAASLKGDDAGKALRNILAAERGFHNSPEVKTYQTLRNKYSQIMSAPDDGTGDYALMQAFAVMTDPNTGVRDAERTAVAHLGSAWQTTMGELMRLGTGARLPSELRARFKETARALMAGAEQQYNDRVNQFTQISNNFGMDSSLVTGQNSKTVSSNPEQDKQDAIAALKQSGWTDAQIAGPKGQAALQRMLSE